MEITAGKSSSKENKENATENLLETHRSWLFGYFRKRVPQPADAEDLTQQTLIAATLSLPNFRHESPLSAWLLGIANKILLRYRERDPVGSGRYHTFATHFPLYSLEDRQHISLSTELFRSMEKLWLSERLIERLQECCSEDERTVLLLYYQGESQSEIATLLQIPAGRVRGQLLRARGKLLAHLVQNDPELLGGKEAITAAWEEAVASEEPPSHEEQKAWREPNPGREHFRAACLRMARFLPIPAILFATFVLPSAVSPQNGGESDKIIPSDLISPPSVPTRVKENETNEHRRFPRRTADAH